MFIKSPNNCNEKEKKRYCWSLTCTIQTLVCNFKIFTPSNKNGFVRKLLIVSVYSTLTYTNYPLIAHDSRINSSVNLQIFPSCDDITRTSMDSINKELTNPLLSDLKNSTFFFSLISSEPTFSFSPGGLFSSSLSNRASRHSL